MLNLLGVDPFCRGFDSYVLFFKIGPFTRHMKDEEVVQNLKKLSPQQSSQQSNFTQDENSKPFFILLTSNLFSFLPSFLTWLGEKEHFSVHLCAAIDYLMVG